MQGKLKRLNLISAIFFAVIIPVSVLIFAKAFSSKNYLASSLVVILLSLIPFFAWFEKRKIKTSEIVTVSMMIALSIAGRAAFAFVPQVKPMCALVIVTAIAFGPNVGFITGAVSMFISNFIFGQGMFTPFQMLGMGLVGFFSAIVFYEKSYSKNRLAVSIIGGILCFAVYGFIVDSCSVLMMVTEYSAKSVLAIYASGVPFNLIHAVTTAIVLFFINKPMNDKFTRLRTKYGIFSRERITV